MKGSLVSSTTVLCFIGVVFSSKVDQTPSAIFWSPESPSEITCRHQITNYDTLLWYQRSQTDTELKLIGYMRYDQRTIEKQFEKHFNVSGYGEKHSTLHLIHLRKSEDSAMYYCAAYRQGSASQAYFGNGTKLTVLDRDIAEPKVKILQPSGIETRCKKTITLVCVAENFYPDHVSITWTLGDKEIKENVATDPYATEDKKKFFRKTSRLKVSKKEFKPQNKYICTVSMYNGTQPIFEIAKEINGIEGSEYEPEDYVKSAQWMKLAYSVFIAKSGLYGLVVLVYVIRKGSSGKRMN